jgi:hypothetical protein
MVPVAELIQFLALRQSESDTQVIRAFRGWVRAQQASDWGRKKPRGRKKK